MVENLFQDLSGVDTSTESNPYNALIKACEDEASQIQSRYSTHRSSRGTQKRAELLSPDFPGVSIDPILYNLIHQEHFVDPRWCLVFWARPTTAVKDLIVKLQVQLQEVVPHLWLMPRENLHMTALEIAHSKTRSEIEVLVERLRPRIPSITDYPATPGHRARLIKPMLSYDAAAIALSFVPAAGGAGDEFSYHHLRRDLFELCSVTHGSCGGVEVASRYVVPSAHLTIARFVEERDFRKEGGGVDHEKVEQLVTKIDSLNARLEKEFWPIEVKSENSTDVDTSIREGGEWIVGQETGLVCRWGQLWYGAGESIQVGQGF